MVVLPSPYAYAWFEAPVKQFNLEAKYFSKKDDYEKKEYRKEYRKD